MDGRRARLASAERATAYLTDGPFDFVTRTRGLHNCSAVGVDHTTPSSLSQQLRGEEEEEEDLCEKDLVVGGTLATASRSGKVLRVVPPVKLYRRYRVRELVEVSFQSWNLWVSRFYLLENVSDLRDRFLLLRVAVISFLGKTGTAWTPKASSAHEWTWTERETVTTRTETATIAGMSSKNLGTTVRIGLVLPQSQWTRGTRSGPTATGTKEPCGRHVPTQPKNEPIPFLGWVTPETGEPRAGRTTGVQTATIVVTCGYGLPCVSTPSDTSTRGKGSKRTTTTTQSTQGPSSDLETSSSEALGCTVLPTGSSRSSATTLPIVQARET
ncbi:hypothetical protein K501DRAFT_268397 [Backusella circina FSU 941]|nr:hypothetical protein K501DRAFT_268397 [Backusella circina FSU 941]